MLEDFKLAFTAQRCPFCGDALIAATEIMVALKFGEHYSPYGRPEKTCSWVNSTTEEYLKFRSSIMSVVAHILNRSVELNSMSIDPQSLRQMSKDYVVFKESWPDFQI